MRGDAKGIPPLEINSLDLDHFVFLETERLILDSSAAAQCASWVTASSRLVHLLNTNYSKSVHAAFRKNDRGISHVEPKDFGRCIHCPSG
jgi:hypothetical protein